MQSHSPSGLQVVPYLQWGSHLTQFFGSGDELRDLLVPYPNTRPHELPRQHLCGLRDAEMQMAKRRTRHSPVIGISFKDHAPTAAQAAELARLLDKNQISMESLGNLAGVMGWLHAAAEQKATWPSAKEITAITNTIRKQAGTLSATLRSLFETEGPASLIVRHGLRTEFQKLTARYGQVEELIGELDRLCHAAALVPKKVLIPAKGGRDRQYGELAYLFGTLADIFYRETGKMPTAFHSEIAGIVGGTFLPFAVPAMATLSLKLPRPTTDGQLGELAIAVLKAKRSDNLEKSQCRK
jgi:hypothetical protein